MISAFVFDPTHGFYRNFRKALKMRTACRLAPSNPNSLVARAFVYMQTGQYQQALQDFRLAVEQDPDAFDARRGEGKCLSMLGRDQEALTCFNQLRRLYPDEPELLRWLTSCFPRVILTMRKRLPALCSAG